MSEPVQQAPERAPRPRQPLFLERSSYRRRRLRDAARLLPVLGLFLFFLPLLWPESPVEPGASPPAMSGAFLYVFGVWAGLILMSALFGRLVQRLERNPAAEDTDWPR